ncbi:MAG: ADP-ribosylglycohydrolase family protein [Spirochaetales bacterium]|nr:ADP-ribosylglycohydrolase family protein [Spirochaetales bacterium]
MRDIENRALGALLGLFTGDAFGAQTEFLTERRVRQEHPDGFKEMDSRPRYIGEAGMITDDSEMAIMLAQSIIAKKTVDIEDVRSGYLRWLDASPSDVGTTILGALRDGVMNSDSQANGALMRIAPIGIAGALADAKTTIAYSDLDCSITHVHPICRDVNRLWALAIAKTIREGLTAQQVYEYIAEIAPRITDEQVLLDTIDIAKREGPVACDGDNQGWVIIALHLSLYTLLHTASFEEGVIQITMRAGDTDTNAAIYGSLAGAVAGGAAIPSRWIEALRPIQCLERLLGADALDLKSLALSLVKGLLD